MNSTFPITDDPAARGLLRVELPHWAAQVRIFDSRGRLARQPDDMLPTKTTGDGLPTVWQATTQLTPGVYEAELSLEGQTARQLAIVRAGMPCQLAQDSWQPALSQLSVAAPLPNTATNRDTHRVAAERWSRELTWKKSSGSSRLFLFVRTLTLEKGNRFWDNLSLLDHNETLITDFSSSAETDKREGWMAFSADLPPGGYLLKRQRYDQYRTKYQPLYLCEGWETHAFLTADRRPSLQTMLLNMVPAGTGFRADDEAIMAVWVLLNSLRRSTGPDRLVTADTVNTLMGNWVGNPWLSILVGYVIRLQQDQLPPGDEPPSERWPALLALWPTLMDRLAAIGHHPDGQALRLELDKPAETAIPFPPLLFPGLRRVQQHALQFGQTIADGSLLKRVLPRVSTTSVWTAWRHVRKPANRPKLSHPATGAEAVSDSPDSQPASQPIKLSAPNYLRLITPKLPVYQVQAATSPTASSTTKRSDRERGQPTSEAFLNVMALQVAQNLSSTDLNDIPLTTPINSEQNVGDLLCNANANDISQASGVPLSQVQSSLSKLQSEARQPLKATKKLTIYDQTVFGYAVQQAIEQTVDDPLVATIEECVNTLLNEAGRLSPKPGEKALPAEINELIGRIVGLSDRLLLSARFVVVTNADGKILLNNGVFATLLNQTSRSANQLTEWELFLKTASFGRSKLPHQYVRKGPDAWILQRTVLHDDDRHEVIYLNLFQNANGLVLTPEQLKRFQKQLPKLILSTSSIAYDQRAPGEFSEDQQQHIEKLSYAVTQMERILTVV